VVAIRSDTISAAQTARILGLEEGHFLDLKAREITPAKLTKTLSALANADGGELYVGIGEDRSFTPPKRTWSGFANVEAANGHLQALDSLFPLGQDFTYTFLSTGNAHDGLALQILVLKTRDVKKASDGVPYVRRGAQNLPVDTPEKLHRLELDKGLTSFESGLTDAPLASVTNSETIISFLIDVVPTAEPEPWLMKQQLIRDSRPTVSAVLLFSDEPQAALPKRSGVKIYRYETKDAEGTRDALVGQPITIEGCIYRQIRSAVDETVSVIEALPTLGEGDRV
jgi:ATP-dependent DNA helicase RecG